MFSIYVAMLHFNPQVFVLLHYLVTKKIQKKSYLTWIIQPRKV